MKTKKAKVSKRLDKKCSVCGGDIKVIVYSNGSYRGGHYFGQILENSEYWECPSCYRAPNKKTSI